MHRAVAGAAIAASMAALALPTFAADNPSALAGCDAPAVVYGYAGHADTAGRVGHVGPAACVTAPKAGGARLATWEPIGAAVHTGPYAGRVLVMTENRNTTPTSTDRFTVLATDDEGATWHDVTPAEQRRPVLEGTPMAAADPYIYSDPLTGSVFSAVLRSPACGQVWRSDTGGSSWQTAPPFCFDGDAETLFAAPPTAGGEPTGYPDVVYFCSYVGFAVSPADWCQTSRDGGTTFSPTAAPADTQVTTESGTAGVPGTCDPLLGKAWGAADGTALVPKNRCGVPWLLTTSDEGRSWHGHAVDRTRGVVTDPVGLQENALAVRSFGRQIYVAWIGADRQPYLSRSDDDGRTWTKPVDVAPAGLTQVGYIALDVNETGQLAVAYLGSRNAPGPPYPARGECTGPGAADQCPFGAYRWTWDAYLTVVSGPQTAAPHFRTAEFTDPAGGPVARGFCTQNYCIHGEFLGAAFSGDTAYGFFPSMPCTKLPDGQANCDGNSTTLLVGRLRLE